MNATNWDGIIKDVFGQPGATPRSQPTFKLKVQWTHPAALTPRSPYHQAKHSRMCARPFLTPCRWGTLTA